MPIDVLDGLRQRVFGRHDALVEVPQPACCANGDVERPLAFGTVVLRGLQQAKRFRMKGRFGACGRVQPRYVGMGQRAAEQPLEEAAAVACRLHGRAHLVRVAERLQGDDRVERVEHGRGHACLVGLGEDERVFQRYGVKGLGSFVGWLGTCGVRHVPCSLRVGGRRRVSGAQSRPIGLFPIFPQRRKRFHLFHHIHGPRLEAGRFCVLN